MNAGDKFILLAEDDPVVAELILHALQRTASPPQVVHVVDGVEALDFLHGRERFRDHELVRPTLTILDVKMPRMDGLEVLRHNKTDESLRMMPVVMLTSSQDERDVGTAYDLGANAYVVKPLDFPKLVEVLKTLEMFWLHVNLPPPQFYSSARGARGLESP
jgi:CheY-like chemotaxis protein